MTLICIDIFINCTCYYKQHFLLLINETYYRIDQDFYEGFISFYTSIYNEMKRLS